MIVPWNIKVPFGIQLLRSLPLPRMSRKIKLISYRILILLLTYLSYVAYHASRKPISVVKNELIKCTSEEDVHKSNCTSFIYELNNTHEDQAKRLEGVLDSTYLFSYAFFMFFSGIVAERVNLRYYLCFGMLLAGLFTLLFGLAEFINVHSIAYFIVIQFFGGAFQTTGWPGVVTVVGNWFGKEKKGLIFGIWNSHTSVGNILGSYLAGLYVEESWGMSFILPGVFIICSGVVLFLFLVAEPGDVNIELAESRAEEVASGPGTSNAATALYPRNSSLRLRPGDRHSSTAETTPLLRSDESDDDNPDPALTNYTANDSAANVAPSPAIPKEEKAISFFSALKIPGVVEFSLCLFFSKLVSYTFLYWLPTFIKKSGDHVTSEDAAYLSMLFDIGGIVGGIIAGLATDYTGKSATTCAVMLINAIPILFIYNWFGSRDNCPLDVLLHDKCYYGNVGFLLLTGLLVNGPYALITTAVSAELGTHRSLEGSSKALATVTSIIDGTGSIGAAVGPLLAGALQEYGLDPVFYMLMAADVLALLLLVRLVHHDILKIKESLRQRRQSRRYASHP